MSGGIRYIVCCDGCGVDANTDTEQLGQQDYNTEAIAQSVRDWASRQGGWLWRNPNTDEEWLTCPECSAEDLSVPVVRLLT